MSISQRKGSTCNLPVPASPQGARGPAEQAPSKARAGSGVGKAAVTGILTSTFFNLPCTQIYAISFNFRSAVIVSEKQYCDASNYHQDSSKQTCIYGCEEPLISVLGASHMVGGTATERLRLSLSFLSPATDAAYQVWAGRFTVIWGLKYWFHKHLGSDC